MAGGGRYDDLLKLIGRREIPATGAAAGIERVIALMKEQEAFKPPKKKVDVFVAQLGDKAKVRALKILKDLRKAKISPAFSLSKDSLGDQLKLADKLGVPFVIILGEEEVLKGRALIRNMKTGTQKEVKFEKLNQELKKLLKKKK